VNLGKIGAIRDYKAGSGWNVHNDEVRLNDGTDIKVSISGRVIGNYQPIMVYWGSLVSLAPARL